MELRKIRDRLREIANLANLADSFNTDSEDVDHSVFCDEVVEHIETLKLEVAQLRGYSRDLEAQVEDLEAQVEDLEDRLESEWV